MGALYEPDHRLFHSEMRCLAFEIASARRANVMFKHTLSMLKITQYTLKHHSVPTQAIHRIPYVSRMSDTCVSQCAKKETARTLFVPAVPTEDTMSTASDALTVTP